MVTTNQVNQVKNHLDADRLDQAKNLIQNIIAAEPSGQAGDELIHALEHIDAAIQESTLVGSRQKLVAIRALNNVLEVI